MNGQMIQMITSISVGALATFFAIVLWPRTRDAAWMLVILGTIFQYGLTIYQVLELVGVAKLQLGNEIADALVRSLMLNVPLILYTVGFLVMIRRKSHSV